MAKQIAFLTFNYSIYRHCNASAKMSVCIILFFMFKNFDFTILYIILFVMENNEEIHII